jgi:hypothetical protein
MTIDLTAALLDIIHEEFKECKPEILFSPAHNEQNLHTMVFESYVEKRDKSILYLMKQMRKQESSIGFRFICFLIERSKLCENSFWTTIEEILNESEVMAQTSSEASEAQSLDQKVRTLQNSFSKLKCRSHHHVINHTITQSQNTCTDFLWYQLTGQRKFCQDD